MDIATGLSSFEKLFNSWLKTQRETALMKPSQIQENLLKIQSLFKAQSKRLRKKRKLFDYKSGDEPFPDPKTSFRVHCFNQAVDKALQALVPRFEQLQSYQHMFGLLYCFQDLSRETIKKRAIDLEVPSTEVKLVQENE